MAADLNTQPATFLFAFEDDAPFLFAECRVATESLTFFAITSEFLKLRMRIIILSDLLSSRGQENGHVFSNRMRSLSKFGGSSATGQTESRNGAAEGHTSSAGRGGSRPPGPGDTDLALLALHRGERYVEKARRQQSSKFLFSTLSFLIFSISYFLII